MKRISFKAVEHAGSFVVVYKKWYWMSWYMLAVNGDPYKFDNEDAANYMIKCLEEACL